ncbi:hypothetical protein ACHZ98_23200 [Streptomyces sp. MAR4 CNY-716]
MFGVSVEQSILDHAGAVALFDDITKVYDGLAGRPASAFDEQAAGRSRNSATSLSHGTERSRR